MRIVVAEPQAPGAGAEPRVAALVAGLRHRGHDVETVALPFRGDPASILAEAAAWRLLDLSMAGGRTIDLLIAAGFPAYFARHPRKIAWLIHRRDVPHDLMELDTRMRGECARVVTAPDGAAVEQLLG